MDGDPARGNAILATFVRNLSKRGKTARKQVLEEMVFDGEMALQGGSSELGRALLEAVARLPLGDDLTDFAVSRARQLLQQPDASDQSSDS